MICPYCEKAIGTKSFKNSYIICCEHCRYIFSLRGPGHLIALDNRVPPDIDHPSDLKIGIITLCVDPRHKMFLEYGTVMANNVFHVRINYKGLKIWMDKTIIKPKPTEW